ncbi:hypothetical protein LCGC14_0319790 [marine sediment metagenome]|uniref:Uncharacterized protein n=1 Tax=marine sediment metagenome TaxID=412755 RepID=A0A0F9W6T5_9ZZZZ
MSRKQIWILQCTYHRKGVPTYAFGKRFFKKGCPQCEEKRAAGKVFETDPTPAVLVYKFGELRNQRNRAVHMARILSEGGTT